MGPKAIHVATGVLVALALASSALGQGQVEINTAPQQGPRFEIVPQSPATREATKPNDADFYREDVRVRHEPAFIEPFVGTTSGGNEYGLSGWTSPEPPLGSYASQGYGQNTGWFSLGFTFVFDYPPRPAARPVPAQR